MADFIGSKCPVCQVGFTQEDEIVVCPHCGAPHHRNCYKETGHCHFESEHESGFEWRSEKECANKKKCLNCGAMNGEDVSSCINCGKSLEEEKFEDGGEEEEPQRDWLGDGRGFTGVYSIGASASAHLDSEKIDGVPVGDIRKFVGRAGEYYVPIFYTLKKLGRSMSLNFMAMIFHGMWFCSRKMYGRGLFMIVLMLVAYAVRAMTMVAVPELAETTLFSDPSLFTSKVSLMTLYVIANVVQYGVIIVSGLFGNKMYMETSIKRVKRINAKSQNADQFNKKLANKGSVSLPALTISATIYYVCFYAVSYFAQPMLEFMKKMVDYFV